ncbi:MAG TPA: DsbA family protein [Stellaceae bacterium]|nr:DsbA family protein [Stellaceae bacterium]
MAEPRTLSVYIDFKSPYAYLAKDLVYELGRELPVKLDWLPYDLDLAAALGSARLDAEGRVVEENRNPHQWRRVRYSYMDCRRQAQKRGLTIRGTRKIWDSSIALRGMLYAKQQGAGVLRRYNDITFERFWKRELDIENPAVVAGVLAEAGAGVAGVPAYLEGPGRAELAAICRDAEEKGVFGVPSFILEGELYWGREHLPDIRAVLAGQ